MLGERLGDAVERVEIAGPGFLNLFMADAWYLDALATLRRGGRRATAPATSGERVNVEFVSANPTGPVTVASARHAAYGDSLARILELAGHSVEREYYVNDAGTPGASASASRSGRGRAARSRRRTATRATTWPSWPSAIDGAADADPDELAQRGIELMLEGVRASLERFRVHMDRFFSERALHERGAIEARARAARRRRLRVRGRALAAHHRRSATTRTACCGARTASCTYFAPDIAYHADKLERGYDRAIDVWGADHHGYVKRDAGRLGRRSAATPSASSS